MENHRQNDIIIIKWFHRESKKVAFSKKFQKRIASNFAILYQLKNTINTPMHCSTHNYAKLTYSQLGSGSKLKTKLSFQAGN